MTAVSIASGLFWIVLGFCLYFLPGIIAGFRGHHNAVAIQLLNLFLGWSVIGWIAALIWAATAIRKDVD